ncbi:MAG: 4-alpha-glucanotransferase [Candidatus Eisenbacteria bacterium]
MRHVNLARSAGLLLHPTSLPGPFGIGDLGPEARRWVDFVAASGCGWWQVLPLGPTGYRDSPYQSFSSFAGNPLLVSPEGLVADGLLAPEDLAAAPTAFASGDAIDYGAVIAWKLPLLDKAAARMAAGHMLAAEFAAFRQREAGWIADFALFMALKEAHGGGPWIDWPAPLRDAEPEALRAARASRATATHRHAFRQWAFARQWAALRGHAHARGVSILGDAPIFVAHDSADVWAHRGLFQLAAAGRPTVVAGVPPDYFAKTGQLWGNPLYRWEAHAAEDYAWWIARMKATLRLVDRVRLDHFRGFAAAWEVPALAKTAETGRWVAGPGEEFLAALERGLGGLPIVAEDLGEITADVEALRRKFGLPGMRILQFGFTGPDNPFLPHRHVPDTVVYTGTHDNDTVAGWFATAPAAEKEFLERYRGPSTDSVPWDLVRMSWASVAALAVTTPQDLLELGPEARMNFPGREEGNWTWRLPPAFLDADAPLLAPKLRDLGVTFERTVRTAATPARA